MIDLVLPATSQQEELCVLHAYDMLGILECIKPIRIGKKYKENKHQEHDNAISSLYIRK